MPKLHENNAAIMVLLFQDQNEKLGQEWLESVSAGWTESSLPPVVAPTSTLSAAKSKEIYSHFLAKTSG
jgi:hypothetical protein